MHFALPFQRDEIGSICVKHAHCRSEQMYPLPVHYVEAENISSKDGQTINCILDTVVLYRMTFVPPYTHAGTKR